jgi:hypothetical protein
MKRDGLTFLLFIHVFSYVVSIIMSFILLLPGTSSSMRSTMYLARLQLSSTLINERSTENTLYSNPSAETFWLYPTGYCARVPVGQYSGHDNDHKNTNLKILCFNHSAAYKFNFFDQFPLVNTSCTEKNFTVYNRYSRMISNCLLAFPIVSTLWIFWIFLVLLRFKGMWGFIIATSLVRFILFMIIVGFFLIPGQEIKKISELCYDGQIEAFGPTTAYKGSVYFVLVAILLESCAGGGGGD